MCGLWRGGCIAPWLLLCVGGGSDIRLSGCLLASGLLLREFFSGLLLCCCKGGFATFFGLVHINDKIIRQLQITSSGRFNFDVQLSLKVPPGVRMPPVAVTPELATVKRNEKLSCQLAYSPTSDAPLPQGLALQVQVTNGRSYTLQLTGRGKRPRLAFSFTKHDFGPCFCVNALTGYAPQTATLRLANEDEHEIYFDMPFVATPFLSCSLPPINSMKVGGNRAQTCSGADEFRHLFDKRTV